MKIEQFTYIVMNKPQGYVCALKDNLHPTIFSLVKEKIKGLHIVGRLDKDTTGIIILTNDGDYTHRATHPKKHVPKTYQVTAALPITEQDIQSIEAGMAIDHGQTKLRPGQVERINENTINLTIEEGKFHQVKKMFFALNNEVIKLHRIAFDKYHLDDYSLQEGEYKILV